MNSFHGYLKFILPAVVVAFFFCLGNSYSQTRTDNEKKDKTSPANSVFFASLNSDIENIGADNSETGMTAAVNDSVINTGTGIFGYRLYENFPNPFETKTEIKYSLNYPCNVHIIISDLTGSNRVTLTNGYFEAGEHSVIFNNSVYCLPAGVYYYCLMTEDYTTSRRMIICK